MTNDQIIEMADQAGLKIDPRFGECYTGNVQLIAFARLIQQAQREEDAVLVMRMGPWADCAAAIRNSGGATCKCDMRTKLVGDGCEVCNPEYAKGHS